ncbi:MAG TPA: shikimate kinase, partial [Anaeromyxobacteraceae bacterium]|nr:shikimate kinase [Anaeromyxobacteraceae bacterium]
AAARQRARGAAYFRLMPKRRAPEPPPETILAHLGGRVRARRGTLGWTLAELAARCGISQRFLSDVEAGRANISVMNLQALGRAIGTDASELLAGGDAADRRGCIALLGFRGAGKSTVGPRLASRLQRPFFELDGLIEAEAGLSLGEIFAVHGERWYRRLELQILRRFLDQHDRAVFATGGGIVTDSDAFDMLLQRCTSVWLKARAADHLDRVLKQGDTRPTAGRLHAMADLRALLAEREPLYSRADLTVDTSGLGIAQGVDALVQQIRHLEARRA